MTNVIIVPPDRQRWLRFLAAGALNTLFGFAVYSAAIVLGAPVWAGLVISNACGIAFNFVTTGGYAFRNRMMERFPRFALSYLGLGLVNWLLIDWVGAWVHGPITAQAILAAPLALLSYSLLVRFVFTPPAAQPTR